jgi:hypothetical protein
VCVQEEERLVWYLLALRHYDKRTLAKLRGSIKNAREAATKFLASYGKDFDTAWKSSAINPYSVYTPEYMDKMFLACII